MKVSLDQGPIWYHPCPQHNATRKKNENTTGIYFCTFIIIIIHQLVRNNVNEKSVQSRDRYCLTENCDHVLSNSKCTVNTSVSVSCGILKSPVLGTSRTAKGTRCPPGFIRSKTKQKRNTAISSMPVQKCIICLIFMRRTGTASSK
jgi:hypothetical protein